MTPYRTMALSVCLTMATGTISLCAQDKQPDGRGDLNQEQQALKNFQNAAGAGWGPSGNAAPKAPAAGTGISYHGGPVMTGTGGSNHVYYIWYGNWANNTAVSILHDFATTIGGTPWFNINNSYYNGSNQKVPNSITNFTSYAPTGSYSTTLSDAGVLSVVSNALTGRQLPIDTNAVYFVLTSKDVKESSGFCSQYCGWHDHATVKVSGVNYDIKYAFVGNPEQCPSACSAQTTSPNGNPGADAMASIIAHELSEAVTDPDLNAWYDSKGNENADKCAWTFGTTYKVGGAKANVKFGARDYLIQQNWVNAGSGGCALKY